jgi:hypothetical protein
MMAPQMRRRRHRMNPAVTWLLKAFAPGCATLLRHQFTKTVPGGERVQIAYDLPDGPARLRADQLVRSSGAFKLIAIGAHSIRDIEVLVNDDRDLLSVDVLLVRK